MRLQETFSLLVSLQEMDVCLYSECETESEHPEVSGSELKTSRKYAPFKMSVSMSQKQSLNDTIDIFHTF